MSKNVLVIGGAGYIGSRTCKKLQQLGYTPIVYDNLVHGHKSSVKWGPIEVGDLLDFDRLSEVFGKYKPISIIHFAAYAYVGESVLDPSKYYRNNVVGSLNLLDAMRVNKIKSLIFSSSCATYGIPTRVPITEDAPQIPINPYGTTKLTVEKMINDFSHAYDLDCVVLRYFNAAGADLDGEIGENHLPETHVIPLILQTALKKREHFYIFGNDYDTPDGTCIRDYVHVEDLAQAHISSLKYLEGGGSSTQYNIGNGSGYSVRELVTEAERVTQEEISLVIAERRVGDPAILISDSQKIKNELGWQPEYSDINTILETSWRWQKGLI